MHNTPRSEHLVNLGFLEIYDASDTKIWARVRSCRDLSLDRRALSAVQVLLALEKDRSSFEKDHHQTAAF